MPIFPSNQVWSEKIHYPHLFNATCLPVVVVFLFFQLDNFDIQCLGRMKFHLENKFCKRNGRFKGQNIYLRLHSVWVNTHAKVLHPFTYKTGSNLKFAKMDIPCFSLGSFYCLTAHSIVFAQDSEGLALDFETNS